MSMNFGSGSVSLGGFRIGGQAGGLVGGVVALAVVAWASAYLTGLFPWVGREGGTLKSFGAGKVTIVGSQDRTSSLGFKTFYYWSGQEVVLHYDAEVRDGGLRIYLVEGGGLRQRVFDAVTVSETGTAEVSYRIPKSGFYTWSIKPTVTAGGRGYDLGYTAVWGARLAY
jgi:hypothetical protein